MLFSLDHKLYSSDYDSDSDSVHSENEPLCRCLHNKKKKHWQYFQAIVFFFFSFGTFLRFTKSTKNTLMVFKLTLNDSRALARAKRSQRSTMGKILLTIFRREPFRPELAPKIYQRGQDAMGKYTSASWLWISCEYGGIARKWYSSSLQKQPFLLAPRRSGGFAKRPQQRAARTNGCFRRLILIYFDLSMGEFNQETNKFGFFTM